MIRRRRVDRDVAHECRSPTSTRSTAPIVPPASPIAPATSPEHARAVVDLDAHGEAVLARTAWDSDRRSRIVGDGAVRVLAAG